MLVRRHRLVPAERAADPVVVAADLGALHGTDPTTVYLSLWARLREPEFAAIDRALYDDRRLVLSDYVAPSTTWTLDDAMAHLGGLTYDELLDPATVAELLRHHARRGDLDTHLQPRGFRLLGKVPRLPRDLSERLVERFGDLQKIMRASTHDLSTVDGISAQRAQGIKEGLARLAETSILDRYS